MPHIEIMLPIVFWFFVTGIAFIVGQKHKSESTSFRLGCIFLTLGIVAPLFLITQFHTYLSCAIPSCEAAKIQAQTIIGVFTVSWAAFGANLLSAVISHK